ncbi:peptidoglycan DD-metalloendopeptidase family protein [Siphonobacter sp. SORGH_AS_0500]|uniref:peptidoglycan DD-metalloendopeptidase family protein n=1 Tax=Siphonobacter sp. SORGH_AS_0500 TaxID=1864824 RepID=UPI002866E413|nr:peptidoglycan DD-metalloendopeptidase family protein [Siphonobacter sp. SORGH_AS_0500]MDR6194433.1 murein DD-endopeptidase MepM/ murein hydrolase activator NlpD [Siphonobacter sp. SORGH_AS_0500]
MKRFVYNVCLLALLIGLHSCKTGPGIQALLGEQSPRDEYIRSLRKQKILETEAVQTWMLAGEAALADSLIISLPFREDGVFPAGGQRAFSYQFTLPAGRRLEAQLFHSDSLYFLDLFRLQTNGKPQRLAYAKPKNEVITYETTEDLPLVLRVQIPVDQPKKDFSLRLSTQPILKFPVAGKSTQHIISFWGAARDGGARSHEGIDVIAPRGTPLIASVPGTITNVGVNNLGGNVVNLSADRLNLSLYYAHLDQPLVQSGQRVQAGDTLGTVGNTGNAITTAPHLHFGIYRRGSGPINPLAFVEPSQLPAATVTRRLGDTLRTREATPLFSSLPPSKVTRQRLPKHTIVWVEASTKGYYRVSTPDGIRGYVLATSMQLPEKRLTRRKLSTDVFFRTSWDATTEDTLKSGTSVDLLGIASSYEFIRLSDGRKGWIQPFSE